MFPHAAIRKEDGQEHRTWCVVETRRVAGGKVVQRPVLYLGKINDSQAAAWRKSIAVFEDGTRHPRPVSLFPDDRAEGLVDDSGIIRLRLSELTLHTPRPMGRPLARPAFMGRTPPGSFLVRPPTTQPQRHALGSHPAGSHPLSPAGPRQRVAAAPPMARPHSPSQPARDPGRARRHPCPVCLPRPSARPQDHAVQPSARPLARPVQPRLRRPALRSDQHLFRGQSPLPGR